MSKILICLSGLAIAFITATSHAEVDNDVPKHLTEQEPVTLAWLGPVPLRNMEKKAAQKADKIVNAIRKDSVFRRAPTSFVCKAPAEIGPIPKMDAVERYLDASLEGRLDPQAYRDLVKAAELGNWLARSFLLDSLRSSSKSEDHYRAAQLLEWLHERKIGTVHSIMNDVLRSTRPYASASRHGVYVLDIAAALQHDYKAQLLVGKVLVESKDQRLAVAGRKMLACAPRFINAYRRFLSGEIAAVRSRRLLESDSLTFTPLHHAVWNGNHGLVQELLKSGNNEINARSGEGLTALEIALQATPQSPELVSMLINAGATVQAGTKPGNCEWRCYGMQPLRMAVEHGKPNREVIAALIAAGADPFQPYRTDQDPKDTPFGRSFALYESGKNPFVLELLLATGKLDPKSTLANAYLVQSTRYLKVMERLLKYGITPTPADDLIAVMSLIGTTPEDERRRIDMIEKLQRRYPFLREEMRGQQGYEALEGSVRACRLELALYLLDHGAPSSNESSHSGILEEFLSSCDLPEEIPEGVEKPARQAFLERLRQLRYDVTTVQGGDCPAWLYRDGPCGIPENDDVLSALLNMGAQPFRLTPHENSNVLIAAITGCRQSALDMMLGKASLPLREEARTVIKQGLAFIDYQRERPEPQCARAFYLRNSAKLKRLLAQTQ